MTLLDSSQYWHFVDSDVSTLGFFAIVIVVFAAAKHPFWIGNMTSGIRGRSIIGIFGSRDALGVLGVVLAR
jgi:hypothetical protein